MNNETTDILHTWDIGDSFITDYWGASELCLIISISDRYIVFNRLESIRRKDTVEEDYCAANMEVETFLRIKKKFLHHSKWYIEYQPSPPKITNL